MTEGPLRRIAREAGLDLVEALGALAPTDLQSVLLEVRRRQAGRLEPSSVLQRYAGNRFCGPAGVDPRQLIAVEQVAWSLLPPEFEPIELSPLCPLGTSSAVAAVDQNKVVAADRGVEVVSDSTNVLALEAALRRRRAREQDGMQSVVRLATSQRQVRAQHFGAPRLSAHFGLLGLVTAGRALPRSGFECAALIEHVRYFVSLVRHWRPGWRIEVGLTDFAGRTRLLEEQLLAPLAEGSAGDVEVGLDPDRRTGRGYYPGLCYKLHATTDSGERLEVGDGGATDWTQRLLSDRRERLVIGAVGLERLLV